MRQLRTDLSRRSLLSTFWVDGFFSTVSLGLDSNVAIQIARNVSRVAGEQRRSSTVVRLSVAELQNWPETTSPVREMMTWKNSTSGQNSTSGPPLSGY